MDMSARKKFRQLMSGKRLVLMPGAYDALSARVIEAEGFEAMVAGGYAAIGRVKSAKAGAFFRMRIVACKTFKPYLEIFNLYELLPKSSK